MKCDAARVEAYADGEIPAWRRFALQPSPRRLPGVRRAPRRSSLDAATGCAARYRASPRPTTCARKSWRCRTVLPPRVASRALRDRRWRWTAAGALAGSLVTVVAWLAGSLALDRRTGEDIAAAAVAAHVRATLSHELIQVASSDQHTVKPWLSARLDYSPPVRDFAAEGFPLVGARIDDLDGHPVATLVYRYREHTVDVFVRPDWLPRAAATPANPPRLPRPARRGTGDGLAPRVRRRRRRRRTAAAPACERFALAERLSPAVATTRSARVSR